MIGRRSWLAGCAAVLRAAERAPRVAAFRADATPPAGEPLIWITPVAKVEDPLFIKGVIIDAAGARVVLAALDWCGLGSSVYDRFRERLAAAAGVESSSVALQSVHQHTAPYIDGDGYRLLGTLPKPPLRMSQAFLNALMDRAARAVKDAAGRLEPFDQVGVSETRVNEVASARRIFAGGRLLTRYSTGGKDPQMAALPEGDIDPMLRTVTLARGGKPLARLHYYATHPQTFCCDGRVSGDFVNAAREAVEAAEGVPQIYFTGCAGDVTVGKYNDGSDAARARLAANLRRAMEESARTAKFEPVGRVRWRVARFSLPPTPGAQALRLKLPALDGQPAYRAAITAAFGERKRPLEAAALALGSAVLLHLPGEPMLEFQKYARGVAGGRMAAVAGYGDISPGYMCTDRAFPEGGYEPSASNGGPGTEAIVKRAIREALGA